MFEPTTQLLALKFHTFGIGFSKVHKTRKTVVQCFACENCVCVCVCQQLVAVVFGVFLLVILEDLKLAGFKLGSEKIYGSFRWDGDRFVDFKPSKDP